ncbi:hypothetical protein F2Q68_00011254 [Brassica cretica]|uniref:Uncharacterized protein n=1 Tax=Brassica cretica TaxID=69181 RepID=A0A8S9KM69_BRACR|nr:hypothetical protein F2Q68_00011254 [Brassica cretica]
MVFREWDPERKRVGIAHEIPNLHQDYGISKQGKVHDDLIRRDQSGLIGLQRNMKKTGIDRGSKILRSTLYTDTCDLGSSSGDGLDNKGRSIMKKLVQGLVLPHKCTSAEAAKAGIRAHPNHDTFMDQSDKEVKLRWQILHLVSLNLQCKMELKETTRICWVKDDHWCLLRIWNKDAIVLSVLFCCGSVMSLDEENDVGQECIATDGVNG